MAQYSQAMVGANDLASFSRLMTQRHERTAQVPVWRASSDASYAMVFAHEHRIAEHL